MPIQLQGYQAFRRAWAALAHFFPGSSNLLLFRNWIQIHLFEQTLADFNNFVFYCTIQPVLNIIIIASRCPPAAAVWYSFCELLDP